MRSSNSAVEALIKGDVMHSKSAIRMPPAVLVVDDEPELRAVERKQAEDAPLQAGALQRAIFNSATFSSIATDAKGVIQIFDVGAERMLGYAAVDVMNKITPADISAGSRGWCR
jgi:PAS domain-containing protein